MIERRREMGGKSLPYDYEVKYLESSGTQWILTNISLATPKLTKVYITFQSVSNNAGKNVFGSNDGQGFNFFFQSTNGIGFYLSGGYVISGLEVYNDINTVYIEVQNNSPGIIIWNDITYTTSARSISQSGTLFRLFTQVPEQERASKIRIYKCSVVIEDNKVLDFISVVDKQGVPAMYDKVSGQLFYNQGTGQFIAGPRVRGGGNNN